MRILIVGGDGPIGSALSCALAARGHAIVATTRRPEVVGVNRVFLDLASKPLAPLPDADVAIICAAMSKFRDCRDNADLARRVNVEVRATIASSMRGRGGRTIALSSSAVFNCGRPFAKAHWPTSPRSVYGQFMADAEADVLREGGTVLRLTKVLNEGLGVVGQWIGQLQTGRRVEAFDDHTFCPLPLSAVMRAMEAIVEQSDGGIFQVSGASDISYAEAARHIAERVGALPSQVVPVRASDSGIPAGEITQFTSLDTSRLSAMSGFVPPQPHDVIDKVYGLRTERNVALNA